MKCCCYDNRTKPCRRPRRGFALVMTIVLIAIAGLVLAAIARHSLAIAAEALAAEEELQQRWAALSCQRAILPRAERLLARKESQTRESGGDPRDARRLAATVRLGTITAKLILADENAKASLNALAGDGDEVSRAIEQLADAGELEVRLRPYRRKAESEGSLAFDSWGQVFALDRAQSGGVSQSLCAATAEVTCWGDGRLNLRRASDEAVQRICRTQTSPTVVRRLLEERAKSADWDLARLLKSLQLAEGDHRRLHAVLTDSSHCYSLWVLATTAQCPEAWFFVARSHGAGTPHISSFTW